MCPFRYAHSATMIVAFGIVLVMVGCPPPAPTGPEAEFSANATSGVAPLTVQFTDLSTPGNSPIISWLWLFGDGSSSTQQNPSYTYTAAGTYNVSLTVATANDEDTELKLSFLSASEGEGEGEDQTETILLPGDVPLEMVWIPAGSFMMGGYPGEQDSQEDEYPQHQVSLSYGFWIGRYELTKMQWTAVMETEPWNGQSNPGTGANSPAVYVSWDNVQTFIAALNSQTGRTFRLPSEAEWEYACRAGTTTRFYWGGDSSYTVISSYAWWRGNTFVGNPRLYAYGVGQKLPNAWGLYDMSGNVYEWCQDWYGAYPAASATDPVGVLSGSTRVVRGGYWDVSGQGCRSANRSYRSPSSANNYLGFRLAG